MKVYRFVNDVTNKVIQKTYTLAGIKCALNHKYSWCNHKRVASFKIIEYELQETRRLTKDEVKQLNNKSISKYEELLSLTDEYITVEFTGKTQGVVKCRGEIVGLVGVTENKFNSLDEAIEIINSCF